MIINGLENNNYLSGNEIFITVNGLTYDAAYLEIQAYNLTSLLNVNPFRLYPNPNNEFSFNISQIVRSLQPDINHINNNSLQEIQFDFTIKFVDDLIADDEQTIIKNFIRGVRSKDGNKEWYLENQKLLIGEWLDFGVDIPFLPSQLLDGNILEYIPTSKFQMILKKECDYKIIKYLNSIGGYQYYIFDRYEIQVKNKAGSTIPKITDRLRKDNFKQLSNSTQKSITFFAKTPFEIQEQITELISSEKILMYNEDGTDDDSKWQTLEISNNSILENNWSRSYENEIEFNLPTINRMI